MTKEEMINKVKKEKFTRIVNIELEEMESTYTYEESIYNGSLYLSINASKETSFEELIKDKKKFNKALNYYNMMQGMMDDKFNNIEFSKTSISYDDFFEKEYELKITGSVEDIIYFLNNNNIECNKILLSPSNRNRVSISDNEFIEELINKLNNTDNIYVYGDGNDKEVSLKAYKKTIEYIDNIVERVKEKNLSPMEQLMYVYDIVRDRKYNGESEEEDASLSRDLTQVITGDKIVCVGFSEIFDKVIKKLGFSSKIHIMVDYNAEKGHVRNLVYVNDDKYEINGIYTFDPTYDRKTDNTNDHFNYYLFFAKTDDQATMKDRRNKRNYTYKKMSTFYSVIDKITEDRKDEIKEDELSTINSLFREIFGKYLLGINEIMSFDKEFPKEHPLYKAIVSMDKEKIYEKILNFYNLFNEPLSQEKFMRILTAVRCKEYYEDEEKFPLDIDKLIEITTNSGYRDTSNAAKFLFAIFGDCDETDDIIKDNELDKQINRVRVAKSLRKVLNKKNNK